MLVIENSENQLYCRDFSISLELGPQEAVNLGEKLEKTLCSIKELD